MIPAAATAVAVVHAAFVAFVALAPFSSLPAARAAHIVALPFVWLHWVLNDSTCALTLLEARLRGVPLGESFVHRIVAPVYGLSATGASDVAWLASIALWLVAVSRTSAEDMRRAFGLNA